MQQVLEHPLKFVSMRHKLIKYHVSVQRKPFTILLSSQLTMSGIHESDIKFIRDLDEVRYHSNTQENAAAFCHASSTSGSQECAGYQ